MPQPGLIFVISAPSGAGKTTLVKALLQEDLKIKNAITHTTRGKRQGEQDDIHYHFVNKDQFLALQQQDFFVETAEVYDQYYGTSCKEIADILAQNFDVILNIEWQGARNVRKIFKEQAISIFVAPPDLNTLKARMHARGDAEAQIHHRILSAEEELSHLSEYDYLIVNDQLETALANLKSIVQAERLKIR